jgi:hypothetical protein
MKIGRNANLEAFTGYDSQTVGKRDDTGRVSGVDHKASAVENLKSAGQDLLDTFDPTNHFRETWRAADQGPWALGEGLAVLMIPWNALEELADLVAGPIKMTKNLGDAALHGALAGIAKLTGDE